MSFITDLTARLPFGKKDAAPEYFFALNVTLSQVTAVVWEVYCGRLDILSQASASYKGSEELVEKSYQALDQALGILEIDPKQVLFGIPDSWNMDDDLKEPYLKLLRRLLKESDLQPLAYVTTTNAISYLLQKEEGVPPTAILIRAGEFVEVALLRGGKVVENKVAERSDSLFADTEKVLRQFTDVEVFPSKILLCPAKSGENINKIKDDLMSAHWMQKLPFLHFPKIDVLEESLPLKAIIFAAASELNPDIDLKHSFSSAVSGSASSHGVHMEENSKFKIQNAKFEESEKGSGDHKDEIKEREENLGFVQGDIKKSQISNLKSQNEEVTTKGEISEGEMEEFESDSLMEPALPEEESQNLVLSEEKRKAHAGFPLAILSPVIANVKPFLKKIFWPKGLGRPGGKAVFVPAILLLLVAAYLIFFEASVTVYVEPRVLEREAEVIADPGATAVDEAKRIIPGGVVQTTVSGSTKGQATGQKQIGDPAKGKVVIYNKTDSPVSLSRGTILTSSSGLKFTLDAPIASISAQMQTSGTGLSTQLTPGNSGSVGVTATAIGPDSNLSASSENDSGSWLSVGNYSKSNVVALIKENLSGGTSKNVTVVTTDDQKKLKAQILDELRQKAQEDLQGKLPDGKKVISEGLTVMDGKYSYNKQVNDQASEFSLSATVIFKGTSFSDTDLRTIVAKLVETNVPDGFDLNLSSMETQADVGRVEKDGKLVFKAKFQAKLVPRLDADELKKKIQGKSVAEVVESLKEIENVISSDIKLNPSLPGPLARLPFFGRNISVTVTSK